jgi:tetratricopeptide (TPR) repeat protein
MSPAGTSQARTAAEVTADLNLPADLVEGALRAFADKYLVRRLPGEADGTAAGPAQPPRYELMHEHLVQLLREAPDPILQRARDAEERMRFWADRMRVAFAPVGSGHPSSALGWVRSLLAQPVPLVESLALWRFAPRGDARRMLLRNLRGFGLRLALAALLTSLPVAVWTYYFLSDKYQIEKILAEAPVESTASDSPRYQSMFFRESEARDTVIRWALALARAERPGQALHAARTLDDTLERSYALVAVAQELMEVGETEEAKKALEEALTAALADSRKWPSDDSPKVVLADGSVRGVGASDQKSKALVNVARGLAQAGEIERAFVISRSLKEQSPVVAAVADGLIRAGKVEGALALLDQIKDEKNRFAVLATAAEALIAAGRVDDAVALARQIKNEKDYSRALSPAVPAFLAGGNVEEALAVSRQVQDLTSRARALALVIEWLRRAGRAEEATQVREKDLSFVRSSRGEDSYGAHIAVVELLIKEGKIKEAKEAWKISLECLPSYRTIPYSDDNFRIAMAATLAQTGEVDRTLADARQLPSKSEQARALSSIADGLLEAGRPEEARKILREALASAGQIKSDADRSRARAEVAKRLARLRLYREARLACDECLSVDKLTAYTAILTEYERAQPGGSQRPLPDVSSIPHLKNTITGDW